MASIRARCVSASASGRGSDSSSARVIGWGSGSSHSQSAARMIGNILELCPSRCDSDRTRNPRNRARVERRKKLRVSSTTLVEAAASCDAVAWHECLARRAGGRFRASRPDSAALAQARYILRRLASASLQSGAYHDERVKQTIGAPSHSS
jgi:hypothetical protein